MTEKQNQSGSEAGQYINLLDLLQVLVKRKTLVMKTCGVAIGAAVLYSLTLPDYYSATAKILPPQKETGGGLSALLGQAGAGMSGLAGLAAGGIGGGGGELYLGMLKSRSVGDAVIQKLGLVKVYHAETLESARRSLEAAVKFQAGKEGIISIITEDKDPKRAALMANTFVDELGRTSVRVNLSKAGSERLFLEKRLEVVKSDLKNAEDELKSFAQQNKVVQVDSQARASIEGISRLKAELASKEVQLAVLGSNQTEQSPEIKALRTGINRLRGELDASAGSGSGGAGIPTLGKVPTLGLEYGRKLREFKIQEAIFEQLRKQYEMAKLSEAKDSSTLQILDEAVVPIHKSRPSRAQVVILAALVSFFAAVLIIFVQDRLARMSEEDRDKVKDIRRNMLSFK
jgi:tyrosine-protein kinase Etk/Wzc